MNIYVNNHTYKYESEKLCRLYFPTEKMIFAKAGENPPASSRNVYASVEEDAEKAVFICSAEIDGKKADKYAVYKKTDKDCDIIRKGYLGKVLTAALTEITGIVPPWGILTGVRPAKLMRKFMDAMGKERAEEEFLSFLQVSPEKTALVSSVAEYENRRIAASGKKSFSLYVSIPFCPTRCSYCSFVSHSIDSAKKLIPEYVKKLCEEIRITALISKETELNAETVYVGGGTPTSLSAEDLKKILYALNENFDMSQIREFTVEAGRPDAIDIGKLEALKNAGVSRICINPQTFSDKVLKNIGRNHTAEDSIQKYFLARSLGFDNINMDFIAGLPGDSAEGFKESIDKACFLSPENITVHALALKRSSFLSAENGILPIYSNVSEMIDYASKKLPENGYSPYYLYRQSKSAGNLENVGWCKKDRECLYNIYMMEEIHTILSVGCGAVTKLMSPKDGRIERIFNFKYPYEYLDRFDEIKERKNTVRNFYSQL